MKLLEAIVEKIQTHGLGIPGKDLFRGFMPAQVAVGTLVLARVMIDNDPYTGLKKGTFQVVTRAGTGDAAYEKATAIQNVLKLESVQLGEVDFKYIFPKHEPLVFPRTDGSQYEASVNYQFVAEDWSK